MKSFLEDYGQFIIMTLFLAPLIAVFFMFATAVTESETGEVTIGPDITGISITQAPTKTEYVAGEAISYEGLIVTATYSDNTSKDVTSECVITPAEGTVLETPDSTYPVTVTHGGETMVFEVTTTNNRDHNSGGN